MYLTVTREEVENLIREKYNLPDEVKVYINDLQPHKYKCDSNAIYGAAVQSSKDELLYHDTDSVSDMTVIVNKENQVQDIKKESLTEKVRKTRGKVLHKYPPRLTKEELDAIYERYADTVEEFLKSGKQVQSLELEGYSASAIRYRYNTAIKMYGFDDQCYASATDHGEGKSSARLNRKDKVGDTR